MNLRERTRQAVRDDVTLHAWLLFADQGFEATTVEQIAAASGMSRRSFFRYFATKEEVVLERLLVSGSEIAATMAARPVGEPAWTALRAALQPAVEAQEAHGDRTRALLLMLREPGLRATLQERQRRWQKMLAPMVAERLPERPRGGGPDPRPLAVACAALVCMEAAQDAWLEDGTRELGSILDEAMIAVAPL
jgi:AcrR family transcriptional regulator